jgi:hypothetical protein
LDDCRPRAKLCKHAVQEFLALVMEYEQCTIKPSTTSVRSGRRSAQVTDNKSSNSSVKRSRR